MSHFVTHISNFSTQPVFGGLDCFQKLCVQRFSSSLDEKHCIRCAENVIQILYNIETNLLWIHKPVHGLRLFCSSLLASFQLSKLFDSVIDVLRYVTSGKGQYKCMSTAIAIDKRFGSKSQGFSSFVVSSFSTAIKMFQLIRWVFAVDGCRSRNLTIISR